MAVPSDETGRSADDTGWVLWVKVERPTDPDELHQIGEAIQSTGLSDRYEVLVTTDGIETVDSNDIRSLIDALQQAVDADEDVGLSEADR